MSDEEIKTALLRAQENWKPRTELARSTPRDVSLTMQGIALLVLSALMIFGGIFLAVFLYRQIGTQQERERRMAVEGVVTSGTIVNVGKPYDKDGRHKVAFRYEVNGRNYESTTIVGSRAARGLQAGMDVRVRYLTPDPAQSWIVGHEPGVTPIWIVPLAGLSTMIAAPLIFFQIRRQRTLLSEGCVAAGVVTKVRWTGSNEGGGHHRASYQFQAQDGQTYKGSFRGTKSRCGAPGTPVTIVYDADNPGRSTRYPMPLVRIEEW